MIRASFTIEEEDGGVSPITLSHEPDGRFAIRQDEDTILLYPEQAHLIMTALAMLLDPATAMGGVPGAEA